MNRHRLALIVNPIAGMGGSVGLKGTDGDLAARAAALGARAVSGARAVAALSALQGMDLDILTCSGEMGAEAAGHAGLRFSVVFEIAPGASTAGDTRRAAVEMRDRGADLLLFVGGDGTAREVLEAVGTKLAVLGVPAGVKMHSAVFATTARTAGDVTRLFLSSNDRSTLLRDAEIMDRELLGPQAERGSPKLYGVVRTPKVSFFVPRAKAPANTGDEAALEGAVQRVARLAADERISLIGPGTTLERVKTRLGCAGSALGVTVVTAGRCLAEDASESRILELIAGKPARLVVGVVGGQGFLFGRGNQQFSPDVIRAVGLDNVVIVSSIEKLLALDAGALLVDTGDEELDAALCGFRLVLVSANRTLVFPVRNAQREAREWLPGGSP